MSQVILITGGARSGKSSHALELCSMVDEKIFIATAENSDDEMGQRIHQHRIERGSDFKTLEEPLDLAGVIKTIDPNTQVAIVDCLTVWLGNLMHHQFTSDHAYAEIQLFLEVIKRPPCDLIVVSNELGMGLVPESAMGRQFRDLSGRLNQSVARIAQKVLLMVSGIPLVVKQTEKCHE